MGGRELACFFRIIKNCAKVEDGHLFRNDMVCWFEDQAKNQENVFSAGISHRFIIFVFALQHNKLQHREAIPSIQGFAKESRSLCLFA